MNTFRYISRLILLTLAFVPASSNAGAQQRIMWQGTVKPERINAYASPSISDPVTAMLKQGDVVDVVLEIAVLGNAWCRIGPSGRTEPLGYVLCFNLERSHFTQKQIAHNESRTATVPAQPTSATSTTAPISGTKIVDSSVLTNKDILDLNKIGFQPEILIAKIKSSPCNFDTSPASLQALKAAGLDEGVILAMVEAPNGQPKGATVEENLDTADASSHPYPTAAGSVLAAQDVQTLLNGFYYKTDHGWQKLEPISLAGGGLKHVGKMFVPGLTPQMVWTFRGAESPIQLQDKRPTLCIKELPELAGMAGRSERDLLIVRFDKKKDHRELQTTNGGNVFTFKSGLSKDRMPDITTRTVSDGVFIVTLDEDLKPGEYMITFGALGTDGYDFGVQE